MAPGFPKAVGIREVKIAHDLYAETNPAFGTYAAIGFCREYKSASTQNPSIALVYLALPIAMSRDTGRSFSETNITTGLLAWLNRYPEIRLNLDARLDASLDVVSASLRLGLTSNALALADDGAIGLGPKPPIKAPVERLPAEPKKVIRRAERLGGWMGKAGSVGSVFSAFGVTL